MRENLLRDLAIRAATDPEFLAKVRQDGRGMLARYGYDLTGEDLVGEGSPEADCRD